MVLTFSGKQVWSNSVDPDQAASEGAIWSGCILFDIPSESFGRITPWLNPAVQILGYI